MSCFAILPHFVTLHGVVTIWCNISATHHTRGKNSLLATDGDDGIFGICVPKYTTASYDIQVDFFFWKESVTSNVHGIMVVRDDVVAELLK